MSDNQRRAFALQRGTPDKLKAGMRKHHPHITMTARGTPDKLKAGMSDNQRRAFALQRGTPDKLKAGMRKHHPHIMMTARGTPDKLKAGMSAKQLAVAACLLAGLCLCSFSWAQTANERFCAALDITSDCPTFSTSNDSSLGWSAILRNGAVGGAALRSGIIRHAQRSCLGLTLQRPVRVAFRWRASSEERFDLLRYIDDGQRDFPTLNPVTGVKFLSGNSGWRDASFEYPGNGPVAIEWCYVKNGGGDQRRDRGLLDQLQITPLPGNIVVTPAKVELAEGDSAMLTLSLDNAPQSNVTLNLTVPQASAADIAISSTQVVLSPDQPAMPITITAKVDDNVEVEETHIVRARSPLAGAAIITAITSPDLLPQDELCAALDIASDCPTLSTGDGSSAPWLTSTINGATGGAALRSGKIGHSQRSCLGLTLQRPVRVAFRWRVSSQEALDRLHYIDDGQREPMTELDLKSARFLSGEVAWKGESFDYRGSGPIEIEWCYIKNVTVSIGDDVGFLDQLQITQLSGGLIASPPRVLLHEGSSATLTLSLDKAPTTNVVVSLIAPGESMGDIAISPAQITLSPDQPTIPITITAIKDNNAETRETFIVRARNPVVAEAIITVIIPPVSLPQDELCKALDIASDCPTFSTFNNKLWSVDTIEGAEGEGGTALRSGAIGDKQESCLGIILQRPVRVAFRWGVSSEAGADFLDYDDGQFDFLRRGRGAEEAKRFLSGDIAWKDASFEYSGSGPVDIKWCYNKDRGIAEGTDRGFLDRLQIIQLPSKIIVAPSRVELTEGDSAMLTLSLDNAPESNVTLSLTVPQASTADIAISSTHVVLSPDRPAMPITIAAKKDDDVELEETHVVRVRSEGEVVAATVITVMTPSDPLPQDQLCAALDIDEESCPPLSIGDGSSAPWRASAIGGATGGSALRSGAIGHNQRSCLSAVLQRPVRVAFRWRVSSQGGANYLHYIDSGRLPAARPIDAMGDRFLSGNIAWRDASFDYPGAGDIDIEWCYAKGGRTWRVKVCSDGGTICYTETIVADGGNDTGFLDRLRVTPLLGGLIVTPSEVRLSEGDSVTLTLSLDKTPPADVPVELIVPEASMDDITISPARMTLSRDRPATLITITANKDNNVEPRENYVVRAQSMFASETIFTVTISPDPLPQAELCAALDITANCPTFSTSPDSASIWSVYRDSSAIGRKGLRNGKIGDNQRSCLGATLQGPVRVAFRWQVSSRGRSDYLRYIDDGQRSPTAGSVASGAKFLSGNISAWRDASFDYLNSGAIDIEWCYIKDWEKTRGLDTGFLDRLQITPLPGNIIITPPNAQLSEGDNAVFTLSLDETPQSDVTISLTVPEESRGDITVSPAQAVLSPGRSTMPITVTVREDNDVEPGETHVVRAQSPIVAATVITITTPPEPLPQPPLCAALDITSNCPTFSTGDGSSAIWSAAMVDGATGSTALHSGMIGDERRSCLSATLRRPARVAFRWRVSSQEGADYLHYIDSGQRNPVTAGAATAERFLSGEVAWKDASFDYPGDGPVDIEWCYIKDGSGSGGKDMGFLDRLQITPLLGSLVVSPPEVSLVEGESATLTLSLDKAPPSDVTVNLETQGASANDIAISPAQVTLSPGQSTMPITVTVNKDNDVEAREIHVVEARSPVAAATAITIITPPEPLPQPPLCAALDIGEEDCPTFSTGDDSSAIWSAAMVDGVTGSTVLRSEMVGDSQQSCLGVTLRRPVRITFRWRVSSQEGADYLHYIDDGRRDPATEGAATAERFLSGDVAWRSASFDYPGSGPVDIEWCYIKDGSGSEGDDRGFLDQLQAIALSNIVVTPSELQLSEGDSETLTLSLDRTPESNATINLTVPEESTGDIAVSPAQVVLSASRPSMPITIKAIEDDNAETREAHVVEARSSVAATIMITVITPPDPLPQKELCAALDISEENCPMLSTSDDSSAIWSVVEDNNAEGGRALRSGTVGDEQRSCLRATLQRPVRVAFRWRVSSELRFDRLHYIDDGQRNPVTEGLATSDRFLSGDVAWRDASFDYPGGGPVNIEWCYIKDKSNDSGVDAGFLDRLQITPLFGSVSVSPSAVVLPEGSSETFILSLDKAPQSNVTVNLTVPEESRSDIAISSTQVVLSASQPTMPVVITASKDDNVERMETHVILARSPIAASTEITIITPLDPLPQAPLCAALDISEEECPTFSTTNDSSAIWITGAVSGAIGGSALRSGVIGNGQRDCLKTTLQRPVRVEFRWQVNSERQSDYLHYIDDGQRNPMTEGLSFGEKFLSGNLRWEDATFEYSGSGDIDIEWCYIKDVSGDDGDDAGFLDQLRITQLSNIIVTPSEVQLPEGSSETLIFSLDKAPESNVTINLTVPTETVNDIAISSTELVLKPGQPTAPVIITASADSDIEVREIHVVRVRSPVGVSTEITIITPPDPLPQAPLCAALDITSDCPTFSTSDDSSAIWSADMVNNAIGRTALRNGMIGDERRSCLKTTLQRPVRVAFRWRVSSQEGGDYLHYIDDGQRNPATGGAATAERFLSGDVAWRDASFDYLGDGPITIEWCYIKDGSGDDGDDAGFLDRLQITELLGKLIVTPAEVFLSEGGSAALSLSLDESPPSNVTVRLTVPAESAGDITVFPAQAVLSPGRPTVAITVAASEDDNQELRETHVVQAQSPVAVATMITVITLPDPPPRALLCAALDISEGECPVFSSSLDSSAVWSIVEDRDAVGGSALRSGMVGDEQRSCLRATLQRPVSVAFRWRVSSQARLDRLHYIDDGQRNPAEPAVATTNARFLSGIVNEWVESDSFEYPDSGDITVEWCYIKDGSGSDGDDAGFLDRLQITPMSINLKIRVYLEGALQ